MEIKKNPEQDLENYRVSFLGIGFIVSLIFIYSVIEWKTYDKSISSLGSLNVEVEEEEIIITQQEAPKTPPPPPMSAPKQLTVVDNDVKLEVELEIQGESFEENAVVDIAPIDDDNAPDIPLNLVENKPIFPGCEKFSSKDEQFACMNKKIFEHIRKEFHYPDNAREMGIQGKVMIKFIINKKGKIDKIEIARGIDKSLDNEAVRIIKKMQDKIVFQPAKQGDNAVNVSYILPIVFKLQ